MFVDGANGCDQAGIKESFHAGAELFGGLLGCAGDVGFDGAAAGFAGAGGGELAGGGVRRFIANETTIRRIADPCSVGDASVTGHGRPSGVSAPHGGW